MAMQNDLETVVPADPDAAPLALFDLDGTLTDPVPGLLGCHRFALEQVNLDFDHLVENTGADVDELIRLPVAEVHKILGVPEAALARATTAYQERRPFAGLEDELYPGIDVLLTSLANAGWRIGIATNQLEPMVEQMLSRLGIADAFVAVAGSDLKRTRTNKVQVITHLLAELDTTPSGIAVIADRGTDMDAAKALQATSIGAAWGFGSIEELIGANADAIAMTPADVTELLVGDGESDVGTPHENLPSG